MTNLAIKEEAKRVPSVWIGCLASYNEGRLHGDWVEIPNDPDLLQQEIKRVLRLSPSPYAEEWAFMDYEYVPDGFGENPDLEELCEFASLYNEHGEAVTGYIEIFGEGYLDNFDDYYIGCYDSFDEFAEQDADDMIACYSGEGVEWLSRYFDYEAYSRDLSYDHAHWDGERGCHVFRNY